MTAATAFETTVYVADYHARRALAAGQRKDTRAKQRHTGIMRRLIEGSEYPGLAEGELAMMLGRSKAAALKLERPLIVFSDR